MPEKRKQHQDFDRVFKENIEQVCLSLADKYFGIKIKSTRNLPAIKIQSTVEREPDFIKIVETEDRKEFILHIEFQSDDDKNMLPRIVEYHGMLFRQYGYPIRHFVVYLGKGNPSMRTRLEENEIMSGFELLNLNRYNHQDLLLSDIPEEIVLAILGSYEEAEPESVITQILERLKQVSKSENDLKKYVKQLGILSRLRNLEIQTLKQIEVMPITYDIETDHWYQEGMKRKEAEMKKAMEQREAEIKAEMEAETLRKEAEIKAEMEAEVAKKEVEIKAEMEAEIIVKMLKSETFKIEQIAEITGTTVEHVESIKAKLDKEQK